MNAPFPITRRGPTKFGIGTVLSMSVLPSYIFRIERLSCDRDRYQVPDPGSVADKQNWLRYIFSNPGVSSE